MLPTAYARASSNASSTYFRRILKPQQMDLECARPPAAAAAVSRPPPLAGFSCTHARQRMPNRNALPPKHAYTTGTPSG